MKNLIMMLTIIVLLLVGCSNQSTNIHDLDKINLEVLSNSKLPEGLAYSFKLKNGSSHIIKQNNVYLSYSIKSGNNRVGNKFKIEATGNKLDIKPNEEVVLNVFAPKEEYENNQFLDIDNPYIEINGYIDQVNMKNHFQSGKGYSLKN